MKKFLKIFRRDKPVVPKMPEWDKVNEMLYDKNLDFLDSTVEKVLYSKDKTKRYVVLKSDKGFFTYRLERLYQIDEEEWSYRCNFDLTTAFWQDVDNGNVSIFPTLEGALKELEQEGEYKFFWS